MEELIEMKLASLRKKYEDNQQFIKSRVLELKTVIETATCTLKSLTSDFYKSGFSRHVKAMMPILIREQKDKVVTYKKEQQRLLENWGEDNETAEFLLEAQDYLRIGSNCSESLMDEFRQKFLSETIVKPKMTRVMARKELMEAEMESQVSNSVDLLTQDLEHELFHGTSTVTKTIPYQRFVYFREFLRQKQGKTRVKVPKFVVAAVIENLTMNNIRILTASEKQVLKALRKSNLEDYRELLPMLMKTLNRKYKMLDLPKNVEQLLCLNFAKLEVAFRNGQKLRGKNWFQRKSMLSLPFLCRQICKENNLKDFINCWQLSKSEKILQRHLETYVKIKKFL